MKIHSYNLHRYDMQLAFWKWLLSLFLCLQVWCISLYLFGIILVGCLKLNQRGLLTITRRKQSNVIRISSVRILEVLRGNNWWTSQQEISFTSPVLKVRKTIELLRTSAWRKTEGNMQLKESVFRWRKVCLRQVWQKLLKCCGTEKRSFRKTSNLNQVLQQVSSRLYTMDFRVNKQYKDVILCLCN